jgi:two-component system, NtrC family, nitrogen regulation sensor histidine kinase NtrY
MGFKSFGFAIAIRVLILLATCYLIGFIGFRINYIHTIIFLYIALILEIIWMINYFNKTNRMLDRFFVSVFESANSTKFDTLPGNESYKKLTEKLEKLAQLINATRIRKEHEYYYLQYVVEHLNTGILSVLSTGKIDLINHTGLKILGLERAAHIDDLKTAGKNFNDVIRNIRVGEQQITQAIVHGEMIELSVRASEFKLFEQQVKLISFHDIYRALDQKELDAWQKVIRVMAHEIMSSVSPIKSLSEHLNKLLKENSLESAQVFEDVKEGLGIINQRSEGLMHYVSGYRQLSDTPRPNPARLSISHLVNEIVTLCKAEFDFEPVFEKNDLNEKISIMADERLLVQAALNILRNCSQAVEAIEDPMVKIATLINGNKVRIQFIDNGHGIDPEDIDNVFIPFFTTKPKGSGIGLTISRQLVNIQGGQLEIFSTKETGTTVTMIFEQLL